VCVCVCVCVCFFVGWFLLESVPLLAHAAQFKDKTGNAWETRDNFVKRAQKYDMVDMADEEVGPHPHTY
jgi:hypothetical protein